MFRRIEDSLTAPFKSSICTLLRLERLSSFNSESRSREQLLSYSSAKLTKLIPASNSIALFGFDWAIRNRNISGGTNSNASIGPIVLPDEDDIAPFPFKLIHSYTNGWGAS